MIDIGAMHGIEIPAFLEYELIVHAFEPLPTHINNLEFTFKDIPEVTVIPKAAWSSNGRKKLYMSDLPDDSGSTFYPEKYFATEEGRISQYKIDDSFIEVETIDISEYLDKLDEDIELLKIDAEGAEWEIINRISEGCGFKRIKNLAFEDHQRTLFHDKDWDQGRDKGLINLRKNKISWYDW